MVASINLLGGLNDPNNNIDPTGGQVEFNRAIARALYGKEWPTLKAPEMVLPRAWMTTLPAMIRQLGGYQREDAANRADVNLRKGMSPIPGEGRAASASAPASAAGPPSSSVTTGSVNPNAMPSDSGPGSEPSAASMTLDAQQGGSPGDYVGKTVGVESQWHPREYSPGKANRGLGQFSRDLEQRYGINDDNWTDPTVQFNAIQRHRDENAAYFKKTMGRDPTDREMYLSHQQGIAGGPALLSAPPGTPAWQAVRRYYPTEAKARAAIADNFPRALRAAGYTPDNVPANVFAEHWMHRWDVEPPTPGGRQANNAPPPAPEAPQPPNSDIVTRRVKPQYFNPNSGNPAQPTPAAPPVQAPGQASPIPPAWQKYMNHLNGPGAGGPTSPAGTAVAQNSPSPYASPPAAGGQPGSAVEQGRIPGYTGAEPPQLPTESAEQLRARLMAAPSLEEAQRILDEHISRAKGRDFETPEGTLHQQPGSPTTLIPKTTQPLNMPRTGPLETRPEWNPTTGKWENKVYAPTGAYGAGGGAPTPSPAPGVPTPGGPPPGPGGAPPPSPGASPPAGGAAATPASPGEAIVKAISPITDPLNEYGRQQEAADQGYRGVTGAQVENTTKAIEAGPPAKQAYQTLSAMEAISKRGNLSRGPTADYIVQARQLLENFLPGSTKGNSDEEVMKKLNGVLAAEAVKAITSKGTNFELATGMRQNPSLLQTKEGTEMLIDILKQEMQQRLEIARMANKIPGNRVSSFQDRLDEYYRTHNIVINRPIGRGADGKMRYDRVTTKRIEEEHDLDDLPSGMGFITPGGDIGHKP